MSAARVRDDHQPSRFRGDLHRRTARPAQGAHDRPVAHPTTAFHAGQAVYGLPLPPADRQRRQRQKAANRPLRTDDTAGVDVRGVEPARSWRRPPSGAARGRACASTLEHGNVS